MSLFMGPSAPMTPPPSSPQPSAKALRQHGLPTPPDSPPTVHLSLHGEEARQAVPSPSLSSEVVTVLGSYEKTNSLAATLSARHVVTQLDPAYSRHLNSPTLAGSSYIVICLQDINLSELVTKILPFVPRHATVVLDGCISAGALRTSVGPTLAANRIRVGLVTVDAEGPIVSGLDSFAPGAAASTAWMCQGIWPTVHTVSSPEAAECLVRFREGKRRLLQAWEGEMRAFCEEAGVSSSEIIPSAAAAAAPAAPLPTISPAPLEPERIREQHNWEGSMVEAAVSRLRKEPVEKALRLVEDVRAVKEAEGHAPSDPAKILVLGDDRAFVDELCNAKNVVVSVLPTTTTSTMACARVRRFDGAWTVEHLAQFDAVAVLHESDEFNMGVLEAVDGDGVFVEWLC